MNKKVLVIGAVILTLVAIGGGVFFWWQSGKELRELNKTLPGVVKVEEKNGQEVVLNTRDGYSFNIPRNWEGAGKIENSTIRAGKEEEISISAKDSQDWVAIRTYVVDSNEPLSVWVENKIKNNPATKYNPYFAVLGEEKINSDNVYKIKNADPMTGDKFFYYIKKDSKIYEIYSDYSEDSVRNIVLGMKF